MPYNNKVLAAFGQLNRDEKFQIVTKILMNDKKETFVRKIAYTNKSNDHIKKLVSNHSSLSKAIRSKNVRLVNILESVNDHIDFEYIDGADLEQKVLSNIISGNYDQAISLMDRVFELIDSLSSPRAKKESKTEKAINSTYGVSSKSSYINPGIVDLNLDNFIIDDKDKLVVFDYEWILEQPVVSNFVKTRILYTFFTRRSDSLSYLPTTSRAYKKILLGGHQTLVPESIYKKYERYLNEKALRKFLIAEDIFQKSINQDDKGLSHLINGDHSLSREVSPMLTFPEIQETQSQRLAELSEKTNNLESQNASLATELQQLKGSRAYKLAKKLAKIKGFIPKSSTR